MPARGEVWLAYFSPGIGREQKGRRPALIVSADEFNRGASELVAALPLTSTKRHLPLHVTIEPPEGGLAKKSFIMCENIRSVSKERLVRRLGQVTNATLAAVEDRLRILLDL